MSRKLFNVMLGVVTLIAIVGAFTSFERKRNSFETLDFRYSWINGLIQVESVAPQSGAAAAGLQPGDRILAVGNKPSSEISGLKPHLRAAGPVMLIIDRSGETFAVRYEAPAIRIDYHYLFLTFIGFLYLAIGLFTLFRGDRNESLLFYFVTLLAFIVYTYSPAGGVDDVYKALWLVEEFARIALPPLTLHFFLRFPQPLFRSRKMYLLLYAAPVLLALWAADLLLLNNSLGLTTAERAFSIIDRWEMLHFAVYFTLAFVALTYTYRTAEAVGHRKQIQWIYLGMAVGFIPFMILYLVPFIRTGQAAYVNAAILPLALIPLAFAVSILKYRLWDVEVVIKEILAYTVTFIFGMIGFSTVNVLLSKLIEEQLAMERNFLAFASGLIIAGVLVPVKGRIESLVEMVLYRETYRHRKAMVEMAEELATFHDLGDLFDTMRERLGAAIRLNKMNLYLRDGATLVIYTQEAGMPTRVAEKDFNGLLRDRALILDQPRLPEASQVPTILLQNGYRAVFPLKHRGELQGLLLCGTKRGDEPLSRDDLQLVGTLTPPLSLAIENARLYGRLRRQLEEIRSLKEYNENIIESSLSAIAVVASDGTLLTANHAFWEMTGLNPDTQKTIDEIFPRLGRIAPHSSAVSEFTYTNELGEEKSLTITASPFNAPDAPSNATVLVIADVSERTRLQRELQEKERLASLGLLAAGVAHEVNTPLTGISSYAQMILADTSPDDPRYALLKKMEQQTFRASHLVNNLLNFAAKKTSPHELIKLSDLVRGTATTYDDLLRQKAISLEVDTDDSIRVVGNAFELQQVVTNLLLNARDAVGEDGRIVIRTERHDSDAILTVSDNGKGIDPKIVSRIFEPLFTTKRNQGGTGLGLAICQKIIESHDGSISVSSNPGQGATFSVVLPLASAVRD